MLCRSSGGDTDIDDSFEGASRAGDQSFSGGLSTTDFEGASMEASQASHSFPRAVPAPTQGQQSQSGLYG